MSRKRESKTEVATAQVPEQVRRLAVFGPPLLLEGEDAAAYDELLGRVCAAVKPVDIIDEIYVVDILSWEWEALRLRRLKWSLIRVRGLSELEDFVAGKLDEDLYFADSVERLAGILQDNLPEEEADSARTLADKFAQAEAGAVDKVVEVLADIGLSVKQVVNKARADKAKELVQGYARGEREAVMLVNGLLTDAGMSRDHFMTKVLSDRIDQIERIDRLIIIAETRRNAALREIDRRRAVLGQTLRRSIREIEDGEFADGNLVLEPPPAEGKNAA
jgi:hypothetical protein